MFRLRWLALVSIALPACTDDDDEGLAPLTATEQQELDHWQGMTEDQAQPELDQLLADEPDVALDQVDPATDATPADELPADPRRARCRRPIHAIWSVNTGAFHLSQARGNGCWDSDEPTVTARYCHSDGDIRNAGAHTWYYDDTNPYNAADYTDVHRCAAGTTHGWEAMAYRDGSWRVVHVRQTRYFAELYLDDNHITDTGAVDTSILRRPHIYPMIDFGPRDRSQANAIARKTLFWCKRVRRGGDMGFYYGDWRSFQDSDLRAAIRGLNACTR
jgi:hypothetical protein